MSNKKIPLEINGWIYNIFADDDFANYLELKIIEDFNITTPDSKKAIIRAYIKAQHELFKQEQEIIKITEQISNVYHD